MTIVDLKANPVSGWKQTVIENYAFPPYWWIRGVTSPSRQALMSQELDKTVAAEETCLVGTISGTGDLLGFAQMRRLEWDSNRFGFEIWRLDHLGTWDAAQNSAAAKDLVQGSLQASREQGCQNLQANIPIDNLPAIHALEGSGFQTMEIQTIWIFDLNKWSIPAKTNPGLIRDFEPADTEALVELARTAYVPIPHRFHVDPHLAPKAGNELWAAWMRNACSGQWVDHIAVADSNGRAVGYSTMKYYGDHDGLCNVRIAQLDLGAMSPEFRNRGIVTDVVIHHLEWLKRRQADFGLVGTQGNNIPPQRVWLKIGFKPATMRVTLHYWADD
jgi:ribosomal protein S18 acetylase RimI-like enzyme